MIITIAKRNNKTLQNPTSNVVYLISLNLNDNKIAQQKGNITQETVRRKGHRNDRQQSFIVCNFLPNSST